ncbi:hypothetical protein T061_19565 [Salmonella enterica subsp. arizonae]|nr:hypothetical protein [Salmonella enterica subsp. arizonae]EEE1377106.1 hypothetical protein [Salmonella enterica subsp. diarizonae]ELC2812475.1 hypothetical protein [Salmonella enterica]
MSDKEIAASFYFKKVKTRNDFDRVSEVTKKAIKNMRNSYKENSFSLVFNKLHGINFHEISFEERIKMAHDIDDDNIICTPSVITPEKAVFMFDGMPALNDLVKSSAILELLGFDVLARKLRAQCGEGFAKMIMSEKMKEVYDKKVISEDRSRARKGKMNRHYSDVLAIAGDTWDKYPNASLAGMVEEIHAHLRSKWNDTPTAETIKLWLKKSNLYPDAKPKNRDFKLVINE